MIPARSSVFLSAIPIPSRTRIPETNRNQLMEISPVFVKPSGKRQKLGIRNWTQPFSRPLKALIAFPPGDYARSEPVMSLFEVNPYLKTFFSLLSPNIIRFTRISREKLFSKFCKVEIFGRV